MQDKIDYIKDRRGRNRFPITHERAVRDSNWVRLEEKLKNLKPGGGGGGGITPEEVQILISGKQDLIEDLGQIRDNAASGASAYHKPTGGIPRNDLSSLVRTLLGKAETALQAQDTLDFVRCTEQSLTTEQQAQARANIGITDALALEYDPLTESLIFPEAASTVSYNSTTESIVFS